MSLQDNLAVMRNPFSTATTTPKVCDGKVGHSVGVREASAFTSNSGQGVLHYILYPGLNGHLRVISNLGTTVTADPVADQTGYNGTELLAPTLSGFKKLEAPDRWRVVSQGLRLTPINNSENNNGWFEAIRVPFAFDEDSLTKFTPTGAVGGVVAPNTDFEANLLTSSNWAKHPSYVTGRLRNLEKHMFYLQPNNERDFVVHQGFKGDCVDQTFDVVLVRVFASASNADGTKLTIMSHTVQNFEFLFDAKNERSRYHSPSINNISAVSKNDKFLTRDPKASTIRNASGYAYSVR